MPARILDISTEAYDADPCQVPSLSQSIASVLLKQSPLHAWSCHPKLGGIRSKPTAATDDGTVLHKLLLGKGASVEVLNFDNYRTKEAQKKRDEAIEAGRVPYLQAKYDALLEAHTKILANLAALDTPISFTGESEVAGTWEEESIGGPVQCRCRLDHVFFDRGVIYDVKKAESAHPKAVGRSMMSYGYHIQDAAYRSFLEHLKPEFAGRVEMVFIFIEIEPPYAVNASVIGGAERNIGAQLWRKAVDLWNYCLKSNRWPGYSNRVGVLQAPPWALNEDLNLAMGIEEVQAHE